MGAATLIIIYRTEKIFKNIILFWVICALDINCIEPTKKLSCNHTNLWRNEYAGEQVSSITKAHYI